MLFLFSNGVLSRRLVNQPALDLLSICLIFEVGQDVAEVRAFAIAQRIDAPS